MNRSECCKSELYYRTDGKVKFEGKDRETVSDLILERLREMKEPGSFYYECGICKQKCLLTQNPDFTNEQIDWICYQIGKWYLFMKPLLEGQHNLGYMKEMLKVMICGEHRNEEST